MVKSFLGSSNQNIVFMSSWLLIKSEIQIKFGKEIERQNIKELVQINKRLHVNPLFHLLTLHKVIFCPLSYW